ncbi:uncharacterized protein LOC130785935 isoform X2 [Actinidia eriantha]|uniref:uncharacterized protein LOC130785935 isoform X2 n=1 Tax=Actinidia eriantha TaxID=165200 RepID=UPI002584CBC2|nr:uncharacterized protein LOC130785935 isoform X2 [Actinidia eriantha]
MAARSIFLSLTRGQNPLFGSLSSSIASRTQVLLEESRTPHDEEQIDENGEEDDLRSRIFRLRLPKRSATNVLQKWASEGRETTVSDLRHISGELRQSRRFKHALEVYFLSLSHSISSLVAEFPLCFLWLFKMGENKGIYLVFLTYVVVMLVKFGFVFKYY